MLPWHLLSLDGRVAAHDGPVVVDTPAIRRRPPTSRRRARGSRGGPRRHAYRDEAGDVHDAPGLAALHLERVEPDVFVRPHERPFAEALHDAVELFREFRDRLESGAGRSRRSCASISMARDASPTRRRSSSMRRAWSRRSRRPESSSATASGRLAEHHVGRPVRPWVPLERTALELHEPAQQLQDDAAQVLDLGGEPVHPLLVGRAALHDRHEPL